MIRLLAESSLAGGRWLYGTAASSLEALSQLADLDLAAFLMALPKRCT